MPSKKYSRSLHAPPSLGTTSDDRFLPPNYLEAFAAMDRLVLTEKLDGQNNCFNKHGVFARTHAAPSAHPWDKPLWDRWQLIKTELKNLEIFGENMYGIHSIAYADIESYFYVFAVREGERWLSWEVVKFYAALLDFPTVPEYEINTPLISILDSGKTGNHALETWLTANIGLPWLKSVETGGRLGGYDPTTGQACSEGFVVRNADGFLTNNRTLPVASNEFDNLFKLVRRGHVKTDEHWTKNWRPAPLKNYAKYKWYGHEYLSRP